MNMNLENETFRLHKESGTAIDPICGMDVEITPESLQYDHKGTLHYFCSEHCLNKFKEDPETYIAEGQEEPGSETSEVKDPVCGMTTDDPDHRRCRHEPEFRFRHNQFTQAENFKRVR